MIKFDEVILYINSLKSTEISLDDNRLYELKELFYKPLLDRISNITEEEFENYVTSNMSSLIKKSNELDLKYKELDLKKCKIKEELENLENDNNEEKFNKKLHEYYGYVVTLSKIKDEINIISKNYNSLSLLTIYKFKNEKELEILSFESKKDIANKIDELKEELKNNKKFREEFYRLCKEYLVLEDKIKEKDICISKEEKDRYLKAYKLINEFYDLCDEYYKTLEYASIFISEDNLDKKFAGFINSDIKDYYFKYGIDESFLNDKLRKIEYDNNKIIKSFKSRYEIYNIKKEVLDYLKNIFIKVLKDEMSKLINFSINNINVKNKDILNYDYNDYDIVCFNQILEELKEEVKVLKRKYNSKIEEYNEFDDRQFPDIEKIENNKDIIFEKIIKLYKKYIDNRINVESILKNYLSDERENVQSQIKNEAVDMKIKEELKINFLRFNIKKQDIVESTIDESLNLL